MRHRLHLRSLLPLFVLLVFALSFLLFAEPANAVFNTTINLSAFKITYHYAVNISVSSIHKPTYLTPFNTHGNVTIHIPAPRVVAGVTPNLKRPNDTRLDVVPRETDIVRLDPRTCPNDLAYCYRIVDHEQNRTTFGQNYSAVSSYILPERRITQYVCIGNNTECVTASTNCYCPTLAVPPPPYLAQPGSCSDTEHLCLVDYGNFVMCQGNLSDCRQQYRECACGPTTACASARNTCVTTHNQLIMCPGALPDCLRKYPTCYCGPDMMAFQQGCTTLMHNCTKGGQSELCRGKLSTCALAYDKCVC